jgi:hypothetical protein
MRRFIVAFSLAVLAGSGFARTTEPTPLAPTGRPTPGMRDPLDVRDPLQSRSAGNALPELSGFADPARPAGGIHGEPLFGEPFAAPFPGAGPRPYWENEPFFTAPPP